VREGRPALAKPVGEEEDKIRRIALRNRSRQRRCRRERTAAGNVYVSRCCVPRAASDERVIQPEIECATEASRVFTANNRLNRRIATEGYIGVFTNKAW